MKKFKSLLLINIFFVFLLSCSGDGLKSNSENSDEFLVEKKSPLVMPPNYDELPKPKSNSIDKKKDNNDIEDLISKEKGSVTITNNNEADKSLETSVLDKIKNN